MIKIHGVVGENNKNNKITFEPRVRYRNSYQSLRFPLIYGHECPICGNVMQALFKAPRAFSLWPYEETTILSKGEQNSGKLMKIFPEDTTKQGKSCYRVEYNSCEGGSVKLTLRNHMLNHRIHDERQFDGSGIYEPSAERPCLWSGIFSIRRDLLFKDLVLLSNTDNEFKNRLDKFLKGYNLPADPIETIAKPCKGVRVIDAIGVAQPVILIEKNKVILGFDGELKSIMTVYLKK